MSEPVSAVPRTARLAEGDHKIHVAQVTRRDLVLDHRCDHFNIALFLGVVTVIGDERQFIWN